MNCTQAAECVSALFDGQPISREAAAHLSDCERCRARLNDYAEMGAELRDVAGASWPWAVPQGQWKWAEPAAATNWLRKWRGTMRIPKFAFAFMVIVILALTGGLTLVKARSGGNGPVLVLRAMIPGKGLVGTCTGRVSPEQDMCSFGMMRLPGMLTASLRFFSREGDRVQIGIRAKYEPPDKKPAPDYDEELKDVPLERYWLDADKPLSVPIAGLGNMEIFAEFRDHEPPLPSADATLDPEPNELRIWSPVMIRDSRVLADFSNMFLGSSNQDSDSAGVLYVPKEGRFIFALRPFEGAIEGDIQSNRIQFAENGHSYLLVTGGPVARANYEHVWVLHQPEWRPTDPSWTDHLSISQAKLSEALSN